MHPFPSAHQLRVATVLALGLVAAQCASASESPTKMGQVAYTTGTGTVRAARIQTDPAVISDRQVPNESGQWLIASLDSAMVSTQVPTLPLQTVAFVAPSGNRFASDAAAQDQAAAIQVRSAGSRTIEPGTWTAALSTLSLALFFFLRRLT